MPVPQEARVAEIDPADRRVLLSAAYRMLGTTADAEDAVQEAYVRWLRLDPVERDGIRSPGAWLMRATARICLDVLGSARVRRERYVGEWLPEPVPGGRWPAGDHSDPDEVAARTESVSTALLLLLETLTPAERVVLVLHDAFAMPYAEIATVVDRTPAACRQLGASARAQVGSRRAVAVPVKRHRAVVAAFSAAAATGRLEALVRALDPDVVLRSDGGGVVSTARRSVRGADRVARFLLGIAAKHPTATYEPVVHGDGDGILVRVAGGVDSVISFATDGERVTDIWLVRNPEKLRRW
ncbi:RNA polymerase sigma factor SigJ [Microbacterium lacticum]